MDGAAGLGDLLECPVCLEALGPDHKVLPCQHTFCIRCLVDVRARRVKAAAEARASPARRQEEHEDAFLLCPECRAPCRVGLEELPSNVILNRILEGVGRARGAKADNKESAPSSSGVAKPGGRPEEVAAKTGSSSPSLPPRSSSIPTQNPTTAPSATAPPRVPPAAGIPGNLSTNPFLPMLEPSSEASSAAPPSSPAPTLPPKPGATATFFSGLSGAGPSRPPPHVPKKPSSLTAAAASSPSPSPAPKAPANNPSSSSSAGHQIYRALYDYKPCKEDELELSRGQLYVVAEKCRDGWYKGTTVEGLKSGVFPGNYVQHIAARSQQQQQQQQHQAPILQPQKADLVSPSSSSADKKSPSTTKPAPDDLIDLSDLSEILLVTKTTSSSSAAPPSSKRTAKPPPPSGPPTGWATFSEGDDDDVSPTEAAGRRMAAVAAQRRAVPASNPLPQVPPKPPQPPPPAERYRCVMSFPSSSQYELDLKEGDVVLMHKRREDGWCKGTLERTGQTGLFPLTFVHKMS